MKTFKKVLSIVVIIILATVAAAFAYLYFRAEADRSAEQSESSSFVTYEEDLNNSCGWKDGKIGPSTMVSQRLITIQIKQKDESVYLDDAANDGTCTRKVNE